MHMKNFEIGDYVFNKVFGNGVVIKVNGDGSVRVKFDKLTTYRTVKENHLA